MITKDNLPARYQSYRKLIVCSNILGSGAYLFGVADALPLLVGRGNPPLVWLNAAHGPGAENLASVVEESKSVNSSFSVFELFGGTVVLAGSQKILSVRPTSSEAAEIDFLDLRPAGFNIYGNNSVLNVGSMKFSGNTIDKGVFIGAG